MLFRQFFDRETSTYSYLLACEETKDAILIDSVECMTDLYLEIIEQLGIRLKIVLDTHLHADHKTAMGLLHLETGAEIALGGPCQARNVTMWLNDQDIIKVGNLSIHALHTPGHTAESFCYLCEDKLFTGDTLLIRGSGRTDFQGGSAEVAYDSLQKLLALPESTWVYPGHDYRGRTISTIKEEKSYNPRLQTDKRGYCDIMQNLNLAYPQKIDEALPYNMNCGLSSDPQQA